MLVGEEEASMASEMMTDRAREFLAQKRIALVGVSRQEKDFSRMVLRELVRRGYDVVPSAPFLPRWRAGSATRGCSTSSLPSLARCY